MPNDRELNCRLWDNPTLREICDIKDQERLYFPSQITKFRRNVETERFDGIMDGLIRELVEGGVISDETMAIDNTVIWAWTGGIFITIVGIFGS